MGNSPGIKMDKFIIEGGKSLRGDVYISGAKNAALPLMVASLLAPGRTVLKNVPLLNDVLFLEKVLQHLGVKTHHENHTLVLDVPDTFHTEAPYDLVRKMRASIYVLGPMLARMKKACVSIPGGCTIGTRPIDLHLKGMERLGARITTEHGYIKARTKKLAGGEVFLSGTFGPSVGATCNVMMAAVLAQGTTIIREASQEPEVAELALFLNRMGAKITGIGSKTLTITGVNQLCPTEYSVIPDRIEAGTFITAAAITRGKVSVHNCQAAHLRAVIDKLKETGLPLQCEGNTIHVDATNYIPEPVDITTSAYPGFPTDMQAQMTSLLCFARGVSHVRDTIYPERFIHIQELLRMGANIQMADNMAAVTGVKKLSGAPVMASDLRASATLVLAALAARGESAILRIYHIDRGYEKIEEKLQKLGARIQRQQ